MTLLALVFAIALDSFMPHVDQYRVKVWHWLEHNALTVASKGFPAAPLLLSGAVILMTPALLLLIQWLLPKAALLDLVFETIVLWFALGPRSLLQELSETGAQLQCSSVLRWRKTTVESTQQMLVSEAFYRLFLPIFWFVLGGAVLAAAVRSLVVFCDQHDTLRATDEHALIKLINWVMLAPAWVLAATFGLMGRLHETWQCWRQQQQADQHSVIHRLHQLESGLSCAASAAIDDGAVEQCQSLLQRCLVAWVAIIAIFTLGGVVA